jgi:sulfatase modifying factor 1
LTVIKAYKLKIFKKMNQLLKTNVGLKTKRLGNLFVNQNYKGMSLVKSLKLVTVLTFFTIVGCGPKNTGDLIGVQGRRVWFHPNPFGMVYIPSGSFHTGQSDQDIFHSYLAPNKQMSVVSFWMDETEITNNEYRQFVQHVIDSIAITMLDDDRYFIEDEETGDRYINWRNVSRYFDINDPEIQDDIEDLFLAQDERFRSKKEVDARKLFYKYEWIDYHYAATDKENLDRYNPANRKKYIKKERTLIYPDTLCFIRDFTYTYNEPMARHYFHHVKYDDYPVVGVNWHMATAFSYWRTYFKDDYWLMLGAPPTEDFRLPTEFEWEYAARAGRIGTKYPWGGPYTRNSKGCMLANFKPLRGNYGADGGMYSVRADAYFPNDYGLYNMAGNVSEWTRNAYEESANIFTHDLNGDYRISIPEYVEENGKFSQEKSPITLKRKVIRGGSWKDIAYFIENGSRTYEYQDSCRSYIGFRCVQNYIGRSNKDSK